MANQLDKVIIDLLESSARNVKALPINLGGLSGPQGGIGAPPGGYIGWLPQTRVAYDETEAAYSGIVESGPTLLDNLNHIRWRLQILESGVAGTITVIDGNNSLSYNPVDTIEFVGSGVLVTDLGAGNVRVTISGGGTGTALTVQDYDGSPLITNVDKIIFSGATITDLGSGDVLVAFSGGGGGFGTNESYVDQTPDNGTYGLLGGSVNGSNAVFTVAAGSYISGSLTVYLNGQLQTQGGSNDFTETSPAAGTFTFVTAPSTGDVVTAVYAKAASNSGNADTVDGYHASSFALQSEWSVGWIGKSETWTYASADDPVYQIYVSGNVTANEDYKIGNKIKCTNNSTTVLGFIVKVGSYDGGNNRTPLDIYCGTDYDFANSAITNTYISKLKSPDLFPLTPAKWSVTVTDSSQRTQSSPTQYTWYNLNSTLINIPIGVWNVQYDVEVGVTFNSTPVFGGFAASLSTSSSAPDGTFTEVWLFPNVSGDFTYRKKFSRNALLSLTSKTPYYLLGTCNWSGAATLDFYGNSLITTLKATIAYL